MVLVVGQGWGGSIEGMVVSAAAVLVSSGPPTSEVMVVVAAAGSRGAAVPQGPGARQSPGGPHSLS